MSRTLLLLAATMACPAFGQDAAETVGESEKPVLEVETLPPDVPEYYLSRLEVRGEVVDDRAELSVQVVVYVTRPHVWQTVPLRLPGATVLSRDYEGDGEGVPLLSEADANGLVWAFRGSGRHELNLNVHVPVTRTATGRRLEMTLPRLPEQFRGRLDLTIPAAPVEVTSEDFEVRPVSVLNERTRVEAFIPGGGSLAAGTRVRLSWSRPGVEESGAVGSVRTRSVLRADAALMEWVLTAEQSVRAAAGGLSVVRVRVPDGFSFADVEGGRLAEVSDVEEGPEGGRWVTARLDNSPSPTAELTWRFFAPLRLPSLVEVGGVEVETARQHVGTLQVQSAPGVRVTVPWSEATGVRRVPGVGGEVAAAVEFRQAGFRLPVAARDDPPVTTVQPTLTLRAGGARVEARHEFRVGVRRGRVSALEIEWPGEAGADGLRLVPIEAAGFETIVTAGAGDRTRVTFVEPQSGDFRFGFVSPAGGTPGGPVTVAVPRVDATLELPTETVVQSGDGWDVEVTTLGETTLIDSADAAGPAAAAPPGTRVSRRGQLFGLPGVLEVSQTPRETETFAAATVSVTPRYDGVFGGLSIQATQEIDFEVDYGSVADVLLEFSDPSAFGGPGDSGVSFASFRVDGRPLAADAVSVVQDSLVRVALPQPSAAFRLEVTSMPIAMTESPEPGVGGRPTYAGVVPVVRPVGGVLSSLRLRLRRAGAFLMDPLPDGDAADSPRGWLPSATQEPGTSLWGAEDPGRVRRIGVRVSPTSAAAPAVAGEAEAVILVTAGSGRSRVSAAYRFDTPPSEIRIAVPEDGEDRSFTWNEGTASVQSRELPDGDVLIASLPDSSAGDTLHVQYDVPASDGRVVSRPRVRLPEVSHRVGSLTLEIDPGEGRTVLGVPRGVSPAYEWKFNGRYFARTRTGDGGLRFDAMSVPGEVSFVAADLRAVFVGGTLLGLFVVACVTQVGRGRRVLVAIGLAVALAVGSVWLTETYRVLGQPVLFGSLLGVVAFASGARRRVAHEQPAGRSSIGGGWTASLPPGDADATVIRGRSSVQP